MDYDISNLIVEEEDVPAIFDEIPDILAVDEYEPDKNEVAEIVDDIAIQPVSTIIHKTNDARIIPPPPLQPFLEQVTSGLELELSETGQYLRKVLSYQGIGHHIINSYDTWVLNSSQETILSKRLLLLNGNIIKFENLICLPQTVQRGDNLEYLTPNEARSKGLSYVSEWKVDLVEVDSTDKEVSRINSLSIGRIPIPVKCCLCSLRGKSRKELVELGEDPDDPGGYFIVNGHEKVILHQEQMALSRIFVIKATNKKGMYCSITVPTYRGTTLNKLTLDNFTNEMIEFHITTQNTESGEASKPVNVFHVFNILGCTEVSEMLNNISLFLPQDKGGLCKQRLIYNIVDYKSSGRSDDYITSILSPYASATTTTPVDTLGIFIQREIFPHISDTPVIYGESNEERKARILQMKVYLLSYMVARVVRYLCNIDNDDHKDSWSNKRAESAGRMCKLLFRSAFSRAVSFVQGAIKKGMLKDAPSIWRSLQEKCDKIVTPSFRNSFVTPTWGVKGVRVKTNQNGLAKGQGKSNVTQPLNRDSLIATYSHLLTVDAPVSRTDRQTSIREVQETQTGGICIDYSPEGSACGIVKNLAITAMVTLERDDTILLRYIMGDEGMGLPSYISPVRTDTFLIVNGKTLGWCILESTRNFLISLRRSLEYYQEMGVIFENGILFVDTSPSRVIRPLFIVEGNELKLEKMGLKDARPEEWLRSGCMEYIAMWEQEYIMLASSKKALEERERKLDKSQTNYDPDEASELEKYPYTHCEIDPMSLLGVAACLTPWSQHNQAPRNTYQTSMCKQALGNYISNNVTRFDGTSKVLVNPTRSLVETEISKFLGLEEKGQGQTATMAFMAYPNTEEDAFMFRREPLELGFMRYVKYTEYKAIVKGAGGLSQMLGRPKSKEGREHLYHAITERGLPMIGSYLKHGDCVIGRITGDKDSHTNDSIFMKIGEEGIVDRVLVAKEAVSIVVRVKIRITRIPQEGDKYSTRNAQKGTIGSIKRGSDFPQTEDGVMPDIIVNPHQFPSRMTLTYPIELMVSKYSALTGRRVNASAFRPVDLKVVRDYLGEKGEEKGYGRETDAKFGYEVMYSASGRKYPKMVNISLCYFQSLKHHVLDKIQSRGAGTDYKSLTRQPTRGKSNGGGLRFGEMERDSCVAHGASAFARERLCRVSDAYKAVFCKECGNFAIHSNNRYTCSWCTQFKYQPAFVEVVIPYSFKLLIHILSATGICLKLRLQDTDQYIDSLNKEKEDIEMYVDDEDQLQLDEEAAEQVYDDDGAGYGIED